MRGKDAGPPGNPGIPDPTPTYPGAPQPQSSQGGEHIYEFEENVVSCSE